MEQIQGFNIRVYGIYIENRELLVTDEFRLGIRMTKLPGGGLQLGEGTIDCLRREAREELNTEIEVLEHFYTTDYFQPTRLLHSTQQLISIYYRIELHKPFGFNISQKPFDFEKDIDGAQSFRFIPLEKLGPDTMTMPVDKKVAEMIREREK
ncbi:MAG: NUDIX domain-containing protein [Bacteroidales bacterium]|nr:NUDIX domain-containing protein [Bacteroidales bacterium]